MPNQLSRELSPYLLQHAGNPVDWRPWGEEALTLARSQQKPIFLSIGYASCHWCHVMAHESFENAEIARLLNEHFVSIKVDREERPDLDMIYMEAVQMMTGRGGWPMSMFLTPEGEPFFGGTYWPPRPAAAWPASMRSCGPWPTPGSSAAANLSNRPSGSRNCCAADGGRRRVRETHQPDATCRMVRFTHPTMRPKRRCGNRSIRARRLRPGAEVSAAAGPALVAGPLATHRATANCWTWSRPRSTTWPPAACSTISAAASTATAWTPAGSCPHFEKMLYDNAMLAACYLEAWQATGNEEYAAVVRQTFDYLLRDMTDPLGGFYSSEDADSEGEEGKFYLWTPGEIEAVLGHDAAAEFCRVYDVTEAGNFEGRNILNLWRRWPSRPHYAGKLPALRATLTWPPHRQKLLAVAGEAGPAGTRRQGAGLVEQPGHRRPGPCRCLHWANPAIPPQPMPRPSSCWRICARTTAGCCTAGGQAGPSTTPISTITPAWAAHCWRSMRPAAAKPGSTRPSPWPINS